MNLVHGLRVHGDVRFVRTRGPEDPMGAVGMRLFIRVT